uniref:Uncharacterized protein n=1 Tax=Oryza punctata TaxID=4537 RepID=A0A0E0KP45_ORYPU
MGRWRFAGTRCTCGLAMRAASQASRHRLHRSLQDHGVRKVCTKCLVCLAVKSQSPNHAMAEFPVLRRRSFPAMATRSPIATATALGLANHFHSCSASIARFKHEQRSL